MLVYWWIVTLFNILVAFYGSATYVAACPHFDTRKSCHWHYQDCGILNLEIYQLHAVRERYAEPP